MAKGKRKVEPPRIRRNIQRYGDPYIPTRDPGEAVICPGCKAIYRKRHWYFDPAEYKKVARKVDVARRRCPACRKIGDDYADGEVNLAGSFLTSHREEIMNLLRNEERRGREQNSLQRIVRVTETPQGLKVTTTIEKLAQRIGRALRKAYQGELVYRWSDDTKFVRVYWNR